MAENLQQKQHAKTQVDRQLARLEEQVRATAVPGAPRCVCGGGALLASIAAQITHGCA